jgi:hypothetical protein
MWWKVSSGGYNVQTTWLRAWRRCRLGFSKAEAGSHSPPLSMEPFSDPLETGGRPFAVGYGIVGKRAAQYTSAATAAASRTAR